MAERPDYDSLLQTLADYLLEPPVFTEQAYATARLCLMDSLGCAMRALQHKACSRLLGPAVPGTQVPLGARVPGTDFEMEPERAAWNLGAMIRWLDFNDTWLAQEWGHPSDNLGAILAVADFIARRQHQAGETALTMRDLLTAIIQAYEIQGALALENSFNHVGLDHVLLVKLASCGVSARLMGAGRTQLLAALSQVFADGQALRTYRHAPNTGSRKSWAAGDAAARGVRLAEMALKGEMGVPAVLSTPQWGFEAVSFSHYAFDGADKPAEERHVRLSQPLGCYVMENILFKVAFPAEFHAQTAVEAGVILHSRYKARLEQVERVEIGTQCAAMRIISKQGALNNPADRDHCLEYMLACALSFGRLDESMYEDSFHHQHPDLDKLRSKMGVREIAQYSHDYLDADKRSIANAVQLFFSDGSCSERVEVEYPLGHPRRRSEAQPLLVDKAREGLHHRFSAEKSAALLEWLTSGEALDAVSVDKFVSWWV